MKVNKNKEQYEDQWWKMNTGYNLQIIINLYSLRKYQVASFVGKGKLPRSLLARRGCFCQALCHPYIYYLWAIHESRAQENDSR